MSFIYIQLIHRAQTLQAGATITLRFPLEAAHRARDLTLGGDLAPLLDQAELDYYVPDHLRDAARLQTIGQQLYRWLDGDDRFLTRAIDQHRDKHKAVALLIEQGARLDHLPWELLHDGTSYLVQQSPTAVIPVRWTVGNVPVAALQAQNRPLHVAFMATAPQGVTPALDFEGEEARIVEATQREPLRLSVEESGNLGELSYLLGALGEGAIDVVHLTGHATHTADGPRFMCEDEVGDPYLASAQAIAAHLMHTPRLLFLSGCRTGQAMRGGVIPSLAATLIANGLPAVLGWGQPVFDPDATAAAATLYGALAQGLSLVRGLAETYRDLLRRHAQNPAENRHWHLLRLYARGDVQTEAGAGSVTTALVTAPRTAGRARLTTPQRQSPYLIPDEQRVPVADRANFVGRRRVLQACLAALRRDSPYLGIILHGMGGQGKSTLAYRLRQRLEHHTPVALYGVLDETYLLGKLNNAIQAQPPLEVLNGVGTLRHRLWRAFALCEEPLLLILDNFEDNFEQAAGAPKLIDGRPLLTGATVQLLDDLCFALQKSNEQGQPHRLLITSRYRPIWQGADALYAHQLDRLNDEAVQKKVTRLTPASNAPASASRAALHDRAIAIADGNPRLLEWLFDLLAQEPSATPDMDALLARMAEQETALREDILAAALLTAQTPTLRQMLARGLTCALPVPTAVLDALDALDPALPNTGQERPRATALGLLEATTEPADQWRVPRILAPLLAAEAQPEQALLAATAARTLHTLWWVADGAHASEAQQLELHRLALAGGETEIAQELANALAGRWNRADQYRYREVIDLVQRTVAQTANARLWNEIGYAKNQLGAKQEAISHYQAALTSCPAADQAFQGTILNNLGSVHDALGEKQEALRYYNLALPLRRAVGDRGGEATTLNNLGSVYDALGEKQEALRYFNLALPLLQQVGDRWGESVTRYNMAMVYVNLGQLAEAVEELERVVAIEEAVGHPDLASDRATLARVRALLAKANA
ncbi:MAG: tetratricopeptide repeat protein [Chloroflexi bacterium]|nr:tetratricopeptide repeat protein [Chloroflexota bacterium]